MGRKVLINGKMVEDRSARVSVFDRGFNYGDGLFETIKVYDGRPFLFKEHMKRLKRGARSLRIPATRLKGIEDKTLRLLEANGLKRGEAYIKIIFTRGPDTRSVIPSSSPRPTLVVAARRLNPGDIKRHREKGVKAVLLEGSSPATALRGLKTLNYLPHVVGRTVAERRGAFEGIFIDRDKRLLEGTSTNLFLVRKTVIRTPPLEGILPGITRGFIIKLAKKAGIPVFEAPLFVKDLKTSEEAFLTNSIVELLPLVRVEAIRVGDGRAGPVTRFLQGSYAEAAGRT
jgi:D-amino acid aminotransferase